MVQRTPQRWLPVHSPVAGLHRRRLTLLEVLAQSVSALAPSAGMVVIPSILLIETGAATLAAFSAAAGFVLLVGWCLSQFARRMAAAGGVYSYTTKGLGPVVGLMSGWALLVAYAAVSMAALVGAAVYLVGLLGLPTSPRVLAVAGVLIGLVASGVAVRGIQLTARLALALEALSIALVLGVLTALVLAVPATEGTAAAVVDAPSHWSQLAIGTVLGVIAFMGFESAATLGVEARRPLTAVPRAVLWTPAAAAVLFFAATSAQVVLLRAAPLEVLTSPVPLAELTDREGLGLLRRLLDLAIATSFFAALTGASNALGRVLFTMAREGVLPAGLGRTHSRFGTPHRALALVLPVVVAVPAGALVAGAGAREVLTALLTVSAFGYTVSYVLASLAMPLFLHRIGELTALPAAAGTAAGLLGLVVLVVAVVGVTSSSGLTTTLFTLSVAVPGVVWPVWLRWRSPSRLQGVGVYDQATASSVLRGSVPREPVP